MGDYLLFNDLAQGPDDTLGRQRKVDLDTQSFTFEITQDVQPRSHAYQLTSISTMCRRKLCLNTYGICIISSREIMNALSMPSSIDLPRTERKRTLQSSATQVLRRTGQQAQIAFGKEKSLVCSSFPHLSKSHSIRGVAHQKSDAFPATRESSIEIEEDELF
ncbi:hypothetical protein [Litoreibacter albidus]